MKKVLIGLGALFSVIVLALILIPIIFKKDIQDALDKQLDENLNAKVYYSTDDFSLSLIKNFPDITLTVGNFGLVGRDVFESDTLVHVGTFQLTLDIMSVIKGESIEIVDVLLADMNLNVLVLADGSANYDIVKTTGEDTSADQPAEESAPVSVGIQKWELRNADIVYYDETIPTYAILKGTNHTGSGDLKTELFDMITSTTVDAFSVGYDGEEYITDKKLMADITMEMNMETMKFTFKENKAALNEFAFGFDGWVSMPESDIDMDIAFGGKEINLKSILSLIPGTYQEYLNGVTAGGTVSFDGYVKGTVSDTLMPQVRANFGVSQGKIAYADYPVPIEQIEISAMFDYPSADLRESSFVIDKFQMLLDGEKVSSSLIFKDFEDYYWDFKLDGNIDLEKLTKIVPLEGMQLKGKINANLQTVGRMSDLDAAKYEKLTTSGGMKINGFQYIADDLPQGFGISSSSMSFNPKAITLESFSGNAGRTDLNMSGSISNYLQYALGDSTVLVGNLTYSSKLVDLDEWMVTTEEEATTPEDTAAIEIVRIPEDIDFTLNSKIDLMKYDSMDIKNFAGKVVIKGGSIKLEKTSFDLLDGYFEMNGSYNSAASLVDPTYDFGFKIEHLSIPLAFKTFNTVKKIAPFAEKMVGTFGTDLRVGGTIGEGMNPVYETMQGAGLIMVNDAAMQNVKLLAAVSSVTKLNQDDGTLTMKNVTLQMEIKNGRVYVEPFDLVLGGRKSTISGSAGMDGSLDAAMLTSVPTGQLGEAANALIGSVTGSSNMVSGNMDFTLGITGTYDDPKVKLVSAKPSGSGSSSLKSALKDQATQKVDAAKQEAKQVVEEKKEEVKQVVDEKKEEVKEAVKEEKQEATDKAKSELKNVLKKKKDGGY